MLAKLGFTEAHARSAGMAAAIAAICAHADKIERVERREGGR